MKVLIHRVSSMINFAYFLRIFNFLMTEFTYQIFREAIFHSTLMD